MQRSVSPKRGSPEYGSKLYGMSRRYIVVCVLLSVASMLYFSLPKRRERDQAEVEESDDARQVAQGEDDRNDEKVGKVGTNDEKGKDVDGEREHRIWDAYNRWDRAHENIVECIQTTTYNKKRVNLAALIPFVPQEAAATEDLLQSMGTAQGQPCDTAGRDYESALVFYMARPYHLDLTGVRSALEAVVNALPQKVRKCFDQILYIDAMLTKEQDEYSGAGRGGGLQGPNIMFYNLFTHWKLEDFTHAAIIEADAVFIKPGWLDAIRATAMEGVWQDGSLVGATAFDRAPDGEGQINHEAVLKKRGREFDFSEMPNAEQFADYRRGAYQHLRENRPGMYDGDDLFMPMNYANPYVGPASINGNALYAIANPCFKLYVRRLALHPFHDGYDHNLFAYRANPFHGKLTLAVYGKFKTTGVFLDVAHRRWNRRTVMEQYPNAYIVTQAYAKAENWETNGNDWKNDFWKNYERWDQSQAEVAQCVRSEHVPKKIRLVVVVPFAPSEVDDVVKFVKNMAKHAPVADGKRGYNAALAFYISSRFADNVGLKAKLQGAVDTLPTHVLGSFDAVLFRDAAVDADAKHQLQRKLVMFQNMLYDWKLKEYTHAAFLEPDAVFVRSGWLDALKKTAVPGVWMDGSIPNPKALTAALGPDDAKDEVREAEKGRKFPALKDLPDAAAFAQQRKKTYAELRAEYATATHRCQWDAPAGQDNPLVGPGPINGNALYSLHDTCFREFVTRAFLHPFSMGFANDLFAYRGNPFHPDVTLAVYGKFRTSGVLVDAAHQAWDADVVRKVYPKAHIVVRGLSDARAPITHNGEFCPRLRLPGANCADSLPEAVIAGPLRAISDLAKHTLDQLAELNCKHGFGIHFIVGDMDGAERLCEATNATCAPIIVRREPADISTINNRILRIGSMRNIQRQMIMELWDRAGAALPSVILMDFDLGQVPTSREIVEAMARANDGGPDVVCALGVWHHEYRDSYYDTFAAVHIDGTFVHRRADQMRGGDPTPPGWAKAHTVTRSPIGHYTMWDLTQEVLQEAPKHGGYFPMQSCFSGVGIYKAHSFFDRDCDYQYTTEEFEQKLSRYANNYDRQPCEHVVFNTCLHARGARIGIDAKLRTAWHVGGQPRLKDRLEMPNPHYEGHLNDDFPITSTNTIASFVPHGFDTTGRRVEAVSTLENERFELRVNEQGVLVLEEKATKEVKWSPKIDKKLQQSNWYRMVLALGDHGELLLFQQVEEAARGTRACQSFPESGFANTKTCRQLLWRTNGVAQKEGVRFSLILEKDGVLNLVLKSATETKTYWSTDDDVSPHEHRRMTQCIKGSGALFSLPQSCRK